MKNYFIYLRVSTQTQDVASQKGGVLEYAVTHGMSPLTIVEETASRAGSWRDRKLGHLLMTRAQPGDVILTSEVTRLGEHSWQMMEVMHEAVKRGVTIIVTRLDFKLDGGPHAQIFASVLGLASMLEREFLKARTREGLRRAAAEGRKPGRKLGSTGKLKLDIRRAEIQSLHELGVSVPKLAARFEVTEKTMRKFVNRRLLQAGD